MVEFEVVTASNFLGAQVITASNVQKYAASFYGVLDRGVILSSVTATVTAGVVSTVAAPTLSDDKKTAYFLLTAAAEAERFILSLEVVTSDGQTLNYTVEYNVVLPASVS